MSIPLQFGKLLREHLDKVGMTHAEFAQKVELSDHYPSNIITGKRTLSLEKLPAACRALKLAPGSQERIVFESAAYLSHAPEEVRQMVADLSAKLTKASEQNQLIMQELVRLGIHLPKVLADS